MYINEFVAGILITVLVEFLFVVIFVAQHLHRIPMDESDDDSNSIPITEEQWHRIKKMLQEENDGKDNND